MVKKNDTPRVRYEPPKAESFLLPNALNMLRYFSSDVGDWSGSGDPLEGDWEYDEDLGDFGDGGTAGNDGY